MVGEERQGASLPVESIGPTEMPHQVNCENRVDEAREDENPCASAGDLVMKEINRGGIGHTPQQNPNTEPSLMKVWVTI